MIAVIADDLTGAVEIAGIGLRFGLMVEIVTKLSQGSTADLLVVATDTRSMSEAEALTIMADITAQLKRLNPLFLFKKVDSVLRGHVLAELSAHLKELGLNKALLIPANPALNRTIINGQYFINGQPIHLSNFANDPDFAISDSEIHTMLRCGESDIAIKTTKDTLPATGIIVGDCATESDLKLWVQKADKQTFLAGGSGLFTAVLECFGYMPKTNDSFAILKKPTLLVSGTTFEKSRQFIKRLENIGDTVSYMPQEIVNSANPAESSFDNWADEIIALLNSNGRAAIAVEDIAPEATNLREKTATVVEKVLKKTAVKELLIEGGATASAIINRLNITRFTPTGEFSTGVVRMNAPQHDGLFLTLKPGSYIWPPTVWDK